MSNETSIVFAFRGNESTWEDNEIRYSLRSIEKNLSGIGQVFIIGDCPDFLQNVIHIPATDDPNREWKDRNIYRKLMIACDTLEVSEDFLFFNDDHFLSKPFEASEFPFYYRESDMIRTITKVKNDFEWIESLKNTRELLVRRNRATRMFDCHCPILYNKDKFQILRSVDWDKEYGYGIKSLYCNLNGINGVLQRDNRLFPSYTHQALLDLRIRNFAPFFSTSPIVPQKQRDTIVNLYPTKSKYEKWASSQKEE